MVATFLRPDADSSDGSWLDAASSNTNLYASVDESTYDDADYIRSSIGDGDTVRLRLSDPLTGVDAPLTVRYRCKSEGFPAQMYGMLTQTTSTSTGLVAYWELEPTSSFATNTYTLSAAEFAKITDFNDLYVSFVSIAQAPHLTGNIDLNFQAGEYYELGVPQSTISSTDYLSCSRASIGYAKNADGTLTSFGNDTLRITTNGLLVEDARTNYQDRSQAFVGNYTLVGQTSFTDNATTAPDGTSTAASYIENAAGSTAHYVYRPCGTHTGAFTISAFLKVIGARHSGTFGDETTATDWFTIAFNLNTQTITSTAAGSTSTITGSGIEAYSNGWFRIWASGTMTAGATHYNVLNFSDQESPIIGAAGSTAAYSGDGTSGMYIWGFMGEEGSFPSSYIPTTTAAATRAADEITFIGNANTLITAASASALMDIKLNVMNFLKSFRISVGTVPGECLFKTDGTTVDRVYSDSLGHNLVADFATGNYVTGVKIFAAFDAGGRSLVGNNGTVATDAFPWGSATTVTLTGNTDMAFGYVRRCTLWNSKLADATLQALTAP